MPYARPTLTQLRDQALSDIATAGISDGASGNSLTKLLSKSILRVLAYLQAAFLWAAYGYLDWIAQQATPATATDEFAVAWGALVGVSPLDAGKGTGSVTFTGTPGTMMPAATTLSNAAGLVYTTDAAITLGSNGTATSNVTSADAGAAVSLAVGASLTLVAPIVGVASTANVAAAITGYDAETEEAFRTRYLARYASPPQGGAISDYVEWATGVSGVSRAWAVAGPDLGSVVVYVMLDTANAATGGLPVGSDGVASAESRGTPATGDQLRVANALYPQRPVTALVYVCSPIASPVSYTIGNLLPNTAAMQAQVTAALQSMHTSIATPGGTSRPDGGTAGYLYESDWMDAIGAVPGIKAFNVFTPAAPIACGPGVMPTFGSVSFV